MYKTILVPIDIAEEALTEMVIPHVEILAIMNDANVHFISVVPVLPAYVYMKHPFDERIPTNDEILSDAKKRLVQIIDKFNLPEDRKITHTTTGSPKEKILQMADEIKADLTIIGSSRPSMSTYLLGSTAAAIVRHARNSVLVVR